MSEAATLQKHVYDLLVADTSGVMALVDAIYDRVPKDPFSGDNQTYASFGPHDFRNDDAECIPGGEHTLQVDVWSRKVGSVHCKRACDAVRKLLHKNTTEMTGAGLALIEVNSVRILADPDGLTTHGVVVVTAYVEDA